jgi:nucleotide-binding universal stress UspA family protein
MSGYGTVLVSTDLSDPSIAALRHAAALADASGGCLIATYVVEERLPPLIMAHAPDVRQLLQQHRETAAKALDDHIAEHLPGRQVDAVIREGIVHDEIVRLARERQVDVIVVGMHGHGFLAHALAGSTAERVLHHAPCPVLVVPHDT